MAPESGAGSGRRRVCRKQSDSGLSSSSAPDANSQKGFIYFSSKEEVTERFYALLQIPGEEKLIPRSTSTEIVFAPGRGWRYVVTQAKPEDADGLGALGEEFVRTQSALFREYQGTDHRTWCQYLGFPGDPVKRREVLAAKGHRPVSWQQGLTLTCRAFREEGADRAAASSDSTQRGRSKLARHGSFASRRSDGLVGFVHFSIEDALVKHGIARVSKRLKRKRGESTGEYTKVRHLLVTEPFRDEGLGLLLLTAVLQRVWQEEPSYTREIFLTVLTRNEPAVKLYKRLGLQILGENTTHIAKDLSRPVAWYQMGLEREWILPKDVSEDEVQIVQRRKAS